MQKNVRSSTIYNCYKSQYWKTNPKSKQDKPNSREYPHKTAKHSKMIYSSPRSVRENSREQKQIIEIPEIPNNRLNTSMHEEHGKISLTFFVRFKPE